MPVNVIGTLKPKNGGSFPIVEAIDVFVEGYQSLADAVSHFATDAMISAIELVLSGKANTSDVNTAVTNLQNQINQIEISASAESVVAPEVAAARVGADGTSYQTLKARLDAENAKAFQFRGELSDLNYLTIAEATQVGCYNARSATTEIMSDKPAGISGPFSLIVNKWSTGETLGTVQLLISSTGAVYQRFINASGTVQINWASTVDDLDKSSQFRGELGALGYSSISEATKIGCYSSTTATTASLSDKPEGVTGAFSLIVSEWSSSGTPAPVQMLITSKGDVWQRFISPLGTIVVDWASSATTIAEHSEDISRLNSVVYIDVDIPLNLQEFKFWDVSGETAELSSNEFWDASSVISVTEGDTYTIEAIQGNSHKTRVWTLCDDEMNIVAKDEDEYSDLTITRTFTVPSGATKLVVSSKRNISFTPTLTTEGTRFDELDNDISNLEESIGEDISDLQADIEDIEEDVTGIKSSIADFYEFENQNVSPAASPPQFWAFESGTAVLTSLPDSMWIAVADPIPVHAGEMYKVIANQGASHKVRTWIVTNDDMEVLATASDHYESPNSGTLYTEIFTIPEGGTKLLLTTTLYAPWPYTTLYKAEINAKPLEGKKLSLLGDSISAYAGTIPAGNDAYYNGSNSGVTSPNQMWWKVLCDETGMQPLVINGWSGSGVTQLTDASHSEKVPMSDTSRDQALHSDDTMPDVIIIAGGVNDYSYAEQSSQIPSNWEGKTAPVKGNSFTETYACMIKEIQEAYPSAIVVCLSTWFTMRGTDNGFTLLNGEGYTQADYDAEIERVAKIMRVPYINVEQIGFSRSNFYPNFAIDSASIPTHPNARGQKTMGEYLADVIPQIVRGFVKNAPAPAVNE